MNEIRTGLVTLTLLAGATCLDAGEVEKAVDYRQGLMNVYAFNATSIRDMVKGKREFDLAAFRRYADDLAAAAGLDMLAGFPEDSVNDDSDASDTLWLDWENFMQKRQAFREQSAKLAEVAAGDDEAAMKEQFAKTTETCKGCHDDFKN